MQKMNPEAKAAWVRALRSGDYKQGRRQLRLGNSFCCLGVLCDISGLGEWDGSGRFITHSGEDASGLLPNSVMEWAGLTSDDPGTGVQMQNRLSDRNDSGATFAEIADLIEKHF